MYKIFHELINLIFPKKCVYCGGYEDSYICNHCSGFLNPYSPECYITRTPSRDWEIKPGAKQSTHLEKVYYFYQYNKVIESLMMGIKYGFHKDKISEIVRLLFRSDEFNKISFTIFDVITWVPMHTRRERWRGFNQTELIAKKIGQHMHLPSLPVLYKYKHTKAQIDLTEAQRKTNLMHTFKLLPSVNLAEHVNSILLIDDVCTTGSTFEACATAIKEHYPHVKIYGLCLARGT
ncbi:MAG: ComF family protein [Candidatus Dojkabacteria bacterium]